ncbi:hypothetical protein MASR1M90_23930 [Desulfovibrionales bacterium]
MERGWQFLNYFLALLRTINDHYAQAILALTPLIFLIFGYVGNKFLKNFDALKIYINKKNESDEFSGKAISGSFFTFGRKFRILAVHQYIKDDGSPSGYKHERQLSRPDQWSEVISIKSKFNLYHKVIAKNKDDILDIVISRNGKENWRVISFNK